MRINVIVTVGVLFALVAFAAFVVISTKQPFPEFKYAAQPAQPNHLVSISQNIGVEDSRFLWNNNGLDLIAQAFALFAAAAATLAILSHDAEEKTE